ncbi:MAG TPA: C10 family peptidase [Verrucomicrobiae bacterium]
MKFAKTFLMLACIFCLKNNAPAAPVAAATAKTIVNNWLSSDANPLGAHLGSQIQNVDTYPDKNGLPLYHVINLKPSGYVIVAGDDQVEPVVAFVPHGHYDSSTNNPLAVLVGNDLSSRVSHVRGTGFKPGSSELNVHGKWQKLLGVKGSGGIQSAGLVNSGIDDMRVSPFIQTYWNQATADNTANGAACYNYFTPPWGAGAPSNYVCGCVATALGQLMYYYQYPKVGVGTAPYEVAIDGTAVTLPLRGGDGFGGPYDWADMQTVPTDSSSAVQLQAVGSLCYDAGVAVNMTFTASESSATMVAAQAALTHTFKFKNAIDCDSASLNVGFNYVNMINPNLDASLPVLLGFTGAPGGHCAVVDGYGYNLGTLYHHLNMGWGVTESNVDDVWYQLPLIYTADNGNFITLQDCLYNIFTNNTGEIVSGRVLDSTGTPISGATITAQRIGGGVYSTTTSANGIYALVHVPSSSTYIITATNGGYFSSTANFSTGLSSAASTNSGNVWGANFSLSTAAGVPVITNQPTTQSIIVGQNATFTVGATGGLPLYYQWQVQPSGSPSWVNLTDGSGYSGSTTANLTVLDPPVANNGEVFQCIVSNSLNTATSSTATLLVSTAPYLTISTLAGTAGVIGYTDAMNEAIEFDDPLGIAVDANTNVYVADLDNHVIRQLTLSGTNWVSTTIAGQFGVPGSANGIGTNALFNGPHGIAVDSSGNVYVADTGNSTIRELTQSGGIWTVTTLAGLAGVTGSTNGVNTGNHYRFPTGLVVDGSGNIYIADEGNSQIRELSPFGGSWYGTTLAGLAGTAGSQDGSSADATFSGPIGITMDSFGNLYVADSDNNLIRELVSNNGDWTVSTIAGSANVTGSTDGTGSAALFNGPTGIAIDQSGDLYVVDSGNATIRRLTVNDTNWTSFTAAGVALNTGSADGVGTTVRFKAPNSIAIDTYTNVYISDSANGTIRGTPLFATSVPAVVQLTRKSSGNPAFMLTWTASVGQTYQVQYTTNIKSGSWTTLTNITPSNWTGTISVPVGPEPQRYYRVVRFH